MVASFPCTLPRVVHICVVVVVVVAQRQVDDTPLPSVPLPLLVFQRHGAAGWFENFCGKKSH